MPPPPTVFICGYYGFGNTGDELILSSIVQQLRAQIGGVLITVMSGNPGLTSQRFGVGSIDWRDPDAMLRTVESASLVIIGGGGLFHDYGGTALDLILTSSNWGMGLHTGVAVAAALRNKPLLLWSVGVGPLFSQHGRDLVRYMADSASAITVRDGHSRAVLEELGIASDRVVLAADPIFALPVPERNVEKARAITGRKDGDAPSIGIALRYWDRGVDAAYWTRQLAEGLDAVSGRTGAHLIFIPFQAEQAISENDVLIARRVAAQIPVPNRVHVLDQVLEPEDTWQLLASCDLVIGMRLHGLLLAAAAGVPAISISYDPKVSSAAADLGLQAYEVPLGALSGRAIASALEHLLANRDQVRQALTERRGELRQRALLSAQNLKTLLAGAPLPSRPAAATEWLCDLAIRAQAKAAAATRLHLIELEGSQRAIASRADEQARQLEANRASAAAAEGEIAASRAEVESLQATVLSLQSSVISLQSSVAVLESSAASLASGNRDLAGLVCELRAEIERRQRELAQSQQELADAVRQRTQAEQRVGLLTTELGATKGELQRLRESKAEVERWAEQESQHINELADWAQKQSAHIASLELQVSELQSQAGQAREHAQALARRLALGPFRRTAHRLLDTVQTLVPEGLRKRVRPVYLPLYLRYFSPVPPVNTLPAPAAPPARTAPSAVATVVPESMSPAVVYRHLAEPKISVVLPVWNHGGLLSAAIRSVLEQTWRNLELIIVDDGSEDDLTTPIREGAGNDPRVRVVRRAHEGLPQTLSAGFRFATGQFFTWTSADNLMKPEMLKTLVQFLLRRPDVDMTYGDMDLIDADGQPLMESDYRVNAQRPGATNELRLPRTVQTLGLVNDNFIGACFLYRAEMGRILGRYDSVRLGTEDYDYWLRIDALGRIEHVDCSRCLYSYRVHPDSLSGRHTPAISRNAVELIDFHRDRVEFFRKPFAVALVTGGVSSAALRRLAAGFQQTGGSVDLIEEPDRASQERAVRNWAGGTRSKKRILVCEDSTAPWLREAGRDGSTVVFARAGGAADEPYAWALCPSARHVADLPTPVAQCWSIFPDSSFEFEDLMISLKARDNISELWDLPSFSEPLFVYAGPVDDQVINWQAVEQLAMARPGATILFLATNSSAAIDPRPRVGGPARIEYVGIKRPQEWHAYFSRASLLIAPFAKSVATESAIYDVMSAYLAAGKPVLATESIALAGFEDAPNTLMVAPDGFGSAVGEALRIAPDLVAADLYLARKSPAAFAAEIAAVANDRLFRVGAGESASKVFPCRPGGGGLPAILLETDSMHRGGLEQVILDMARTLHRRKYRVSLVVTGRAGDMAAQCRASGIAVHETGYDVASYQRLLTTEAPDVVIPHYSNFGAPLAWRRSIPVLSFIHNSYIWTTEEQNRSIQECNLFVTHYIAVSQTAARFFSGKYLVAPEKITCIPNGIDVRRYERSARPQIQRASLGLDPKDFVVLCVASIVGTKAQIHAIAAVRALKREIPGLRLLLVGEEVDPTYAAAIRDFIRDSGLADCVLMPGHTNDVGAYYGVADVFLLSSLTEGWSLAKTEAMLHGLPLILTDVGGAAEAIQNGDIGILVPAAYENPLQLNASNLAQYCRERSPRNLEALVAAVRTMHANLDEWRQKAKLGREKVLHCYDYEKVADRHCREIDRLLAAHGLEGSLNDATQVAV
jgi:polysaccharide pyruvyl transferase CsaB